MIFQESRGSKYFTWLLKNKKCVLEFFFCWMKNGRNYSRWKFQSPSAPHDASYKLDSDKGELYVSLSRKLVINFIMKYKVLAYLQCPPGLMSVVSLQHPHHEWTKTAHQSQTKILFCPSGGHNRKKNSCAFTWDAMLSRESPLNRKPIATDGGTGCFRVVTKRYIVVQITNPVYSFLSKNYYCKESKETPYTVHNRLINLEYQTVVITDKFSSGGDCNSYKEDDYSATMKVNAF